MKFFKLLFLNTIKADEDALPINRYFTTLKPPLTYIQPDEQDFFELDLNFSLQEGFEQYSQRPVTINPMMRGRMIAPRARNPKEMIHPNTKNIAGMLRVRLLAMGLKHDFKDLLGYGCWCNFLIKHDLRPKNMMPVDEIDEICRLWSKCHECSSIDSYYQCSEQGHDQYKVRGVVATGMFMCQSNKDPCALKACECDTALVYKLSDLLSRKQVFNERNTYKRGYNPYTQCAKVRLVSQKKADQCCGEGTSRYPFYSNSGTKACCKQKTYDTNLFNCCPDGRLVPVGRRCIYNKF